MKKKVIYTIITLLTLTIYVVLINNLNIKYNETIELIVSGISVPYYVLVSVDFVVFPVLSCLIASNIIEKDDN